MYEKFDERINHLQKGQNVFTADSAQKENK